MYVLAVCVCVWGGEDFDINVFCSNTRNIRKVVAPVLLLLIESKLIPMMKYVTLPSLVRLCHGEKYRTRRLTALYYY